MAKFIVLTEECDGGIVFQNVDTIDCFYQHKDRPDVREVELTTGDSWYVTETIAEIGKKIIE